MNPLSWLAWFLFGSVESCRVSRDHTPARTPAHPNSPSARFPRTGHVDDQHDGFDGLDRWWGKSAKVHKRP